MSYLKNKYVTIWLKDPVVHDQVYNNHERERKYYVMGRLIKSDMISAVVRNNTMMGAYEEEVPRGNIVKIERTLTDKEIIDEENLEALNENPIRYYVECVLNPINDLSTAIMWELEKVKRFLIKIKNKLLNIK